jgi:hypothetical protein
MTYSLFQHAPTPWFADIDGTVYDANERKVLRIARKHDGRYIFDIIADALVAFSNGQNFDRLFEEIGTEPWSYDGLSWAKAGDLKIGHTLSTRGDSDDETEVGTALCDLVNAERKSFLKEKTDAGTTTEP